MFKRNTKYRPILIDTCRARLARRARSMILRAGAILYGLRTKLATAAVIGLAVLLALHVVFGANGMIAYQKKRAEYRQLQKDVEQLQKENDTLSQRIKALKSDPAAIEKEAREQLHYARPGEVIYLSPNQPNPNAPPPNASAKK